MKSIVNRQSDRTNSPRMRTMSSVMFPIAGLITILFVPFLLGSPDQSIAADSDVAVATSAERSPEDWPMPRGDNESTGAAKQTLPISLEVLWEYKADEAIESTPTVAGDLVFFADVFGQLYAVNREDGKERWRRNFDTGFLSSPSIEKDSGRSSLLVIGDVEGTLYGIQAETGEEIWKQSTEGEINGSAAFFEDKVLVTSQDGTLYCFLAKDGSPVWAYQTDDQIQCSPTIAEDRSFLGGCDGQLHVVDLATGKAIGQPLPLDGPTGSTPAVSGTRAVVPIMDGIVYAFDWKKHQQLWQYEDPDRAQEYRSSAAVAGDLAIVSSQYKHVDAISIETGKRLWRHTLKRRADASPVVAGDDVWIAATDGRLVRLSLADGKEKWQYEIRGSFLAGPAIAGDSLFIADDDGVVRRFGVKK